MFVQNISKFVLALVFLIGTSGCAQFVGDKSNMFDFKPVGGEVCKVYTTTELHTYKNGNKIDEMFRVGNVLILNKTFFSMKSEMSAWNPLAYKSSADHCAKLEKEGSEYVLYTQSSCAENAQRTPTGIRETNENDAVIRSVAYMYGGISEAEQLNGCYNIRFDHIKNWKPAS